MSKNSTTKKVDELLGNFREFTGEWKTWKEQTSDRLINIEVNLSSMKSECDGRRYHANILNELKATTEDNKKRLQEIEKLDATQEVRFSPKEKTQLNATTGGTILMAVWEIVKFWLKL